MAPAAPCPPRPGAGEGTPCPSPWGPHLGPAGGRVSLCAVTGAGGTSPRSRPSLGCVLPNFALFPAKKMAQPPAGHGRTESMGAGKAIAVLTSGGDAQGKGHPATPNPGGPAGRVLFWGQTRRKQDFGG